MMYPGDDARKAAERKAAEHADNPWYSISGKRWHTAEEVSASQADLDVVARQLGREPRGVIEIAYYTPMVFLRWSDRARLPDGTLLPTLYYLTGIRG